MLDKIVHIPFLFQNHYNLLKYLNNSEFHQLLYFLHLLKQIDFFSIFLIIDIVLQYCDSEIIFASNFFFAILLITEFKHILLLLILKTSYK